MYSDLSIKEFTNNAFVSGATRQASGQTHTLNRINSTTLANVTYFNDGFNTPKLRLPSVTPGQNFYRTLDATYGWDTNWKAVVLRAYKDFLIAMNVTEGNDSNPNRVRWSAAASANQPPTSWDASDPAVAAGFNDLVEMTSPIVDGLGLNTNFVIYTSDQVWQMEFVGGTFVFNFRKLFEDRGMIHQNCAVEVNGRHYVFDRNDIYTHDGVSVQSICDGRVRNTIFDRIDLSKTHTFFAMHFKDYGEIYFCYNSERMGQKFSAVDCCNEAAVYNYNTDTWSFVDLPNVLNGDRATLGTVQQYNSAGALTYETVGGSYLSLGSKFRQYNVVLSEEDSEDICLDETRLVAYDSAESTQLVLPLAENLNGDAFVERQTIDLDQEAGLPLATYKVIERIVPVLETFDQDKTFEFTFGAALQLQQAPAYDAVQNFDLASHFKLDSRIGGRFLSYKFRTSGEKEFRLSGMDLSVAVTGRRA